MDCIIILPCLLGLLTCLLFINIYDKDFMNSTHTYLSSVSATIEIEVTSVRKSAFEGCQYNGLTRKNVFSGNFRVPQNDSQLLGFVRKCVLDPSPPAYDLADPTGDPSAVQGVPKYVLDLLGNKKHGVYIDCGSSGEEDISNTLVLEQEFGWSGLLIEADPKNVEKLLEKRRKGWVASACAGIHTYPYETEMYRHNDMELTSRLVEDGVCANGTDWRITIIKVRCLPLYTMMSALNVKNVDYMSMGVEGVELKVLSTLPFDKIKVKVFSIETLPENLYAVRAFMHSKGYTSVKTIRVRFVEHDVFAHKSLLTDTI